MDQDQLELLITRHLDGSLAPAESVVLQAQLDASSEARDLLETHRRLGVVLAQPSGMPELDWDRLAGHLSNLIADAMPETDVLAGSFDEADEPPAAYRMPWAWRIGSLAAAACVIVASTLALSGFHLGHASRSRSAHAAALAQVQGPQIEPSVGQPLVDVSIGPAPVLAAGQNRWNYADSVVARPSHVTIASSTAPPEDADPALY